jgi:streptomycin 6-kinase
VALAAGPAPAVLLHGDLHPGNGRPERGLVVVDPRACVGDRARLWATYPPLARRLAALERMEERLQASV